MIKALSTDIDGVLHASTAIQGLELATLALQGAQPILALGLFAWTDKLEQALASSCGDDCVLLVHSSWRLQPWVSDRLMRELLGPLGHRYHGMTCPDLPREASITDLCRRAGLDDYLILDDADNEFSQEHARLVRTNPLLGVSDECVLQRIQDWARPPSAVPRRPQLAALA